MEYELNKINHALFMKPILTLIGEIESSYFRDKSEKFLQCRLKF